jgi:hypothetical protein
MSATKPPELLLVLICESVRQEPLGKLSVLGWYNGDEIILHRLPSAPDPWIPTLPGLAFLFQFLGGEGTFPVKFSFADPAGKQIAEMDFGEKEFRPGARTTLAITGNGPISLKNFGSYVACVSVGEKKFRHKIHIKEGAPLSDAAASLPQLPPSLPESSGSGRGAPKRKRKKN